MTSALITVGLPIALAIIRFGLGLSLTTDDFRPVARTPKAVAVAALVLQHAPSVGRSPSPAVTLRCASRVRRAAISSRYWRLSGENIPRLSGFRPCLG